MPKPNHYLMVLRAMDHVKVTVFKHDGSSQTIGCDDREKANRMVCLLTVNPRVDRIVVH